MQIHYFFNYMSIFLVGMMGSGKSSVGIKLSEILQKEFFDLDSKVERDFGMKIAEIFQEFGEEKFRDLESAALRELCDCPNIIVATGGGVLQREQNVSLLKQKRVFFLDADPEKLYQRARKRKFKRPKMKNLSMEGFIELYKERRNLYSSVANFTINVNELKPFEIAEKIKNHESN